MVLGNDFNWFDPVEPLKFSSPFSPEPAQDHHGDGEGDQRGAVAHGVQSLHRHVVHVLEDTKTS